MPITHRRATPSDIESLVTLRAAFLAEVRGENPSDPALLASLSEYFSTTLPTGQFIAWLAIADNQVVATSGLVFHQHPPRSPHLNGHEAYIMNMYTLPRFRARGLASTLLNKLIDHVRRETSCREISLHASPKARPIYSRAGFVQADDEMRLHL